MSNKLNIIIGVVILGIAVSLFVIFKHCINSVPVKVKPYRTMMSGDMSKYLKLYNGEYELATVDKESSYAYSTISIKVKVIKEMSTYDWDDAETDRVDFTLTFLDDDGIPVSGANSLSAYKYDELRAALANGDGELMLTFSTDKYLEDPVPDKLEDKIKTFSITSAIIKKEPEPVVSKTKVEESSDDESDPDEETTVDESNDEDEGGAISRNVRKGFRKLKKATKTLIND